MQLIIRDLCAIRNDQILFKNLSLTVKSGEILWVQGANGAGKTTLLQIIFGLLPSDSGDILTQPEAVMDYLGHQRNLTPLFSVRQELEWWHDGDISVGLELWQLAPLQETKIDKLSQGQRKRVELAKMTLADAPIWLLDEPWSDLDSQHQQILNQVLTQRSKQGLITILTSHEAPNLKPLRRIELS